jgi:5-methylcytosine-specific restriction protein B
MVAVALELMWRTDILPLLEEHHFGDRNVHVRARYGLDVLKKSISAKAAAALEDNAESSDDAGTAGSD